MGGLEVVWRVVGGLEVGVGEDWAED